MVISYNFHFSVGGNYHLIEIYKSYTSEKGVIDFVIAFEDGNFSKVVKNIKHWNVNYLTKEQIEKLKNLAKYKENGIIGENCEYYNN